MELDDETLDAVLRRWPVARLATVTPAGAPHVLPVVFVAEAGCVYSPVDGKRKDAAPGAAGGATTLARVRNVLANGQASLVLDEYQADWSRLWWVKLDGPARVHRGAGDLADRIARRLRDKYVQYRDVEPFRGEPTLLMLRWARVTAWSQAGGPAPIRRAAGL